MADLDNKIRNILHEGVTWVADLDGLHVRDIPKHILEDPSVERITPKDLRHFEALAKIAAKSGDPKKIDRWGEVKEAAKLFTYEYYVKSGRKDTFSRGSMSQADAINDYKKLRDLRPKINQALGLNKVNHPLARFAEKVQLAQLHSWRSLSVFDKFANEVSSLIQETGKRKLTILYPAAGTHYAYLQTIMQLVKYNDVDRVKVIATDIQDNASKMEHDFKELEEAGLIRNLNLSRKYQFDSGGTEQSLTFQVESPLGFIPVEIVLAVGRSGKAYFRDEYMAQADVAIIHDPDPKDENDLLKDMVNSRQRLALNKHQLIIREGRSRPDIKYTEKNMGIVPTEILGQYGHCEDENALGLGEFYDCEAVSAHVLKLQ